MALNFVRLNSGRSGKEPVLIWGKGKSWPELF